MLKSKILGLDYIYFHHDEQDRLDFVRKHLNSEKFILNSDVQLMYRSLDDRLMIVRVESFKRVWLWVFYPETFEIYMFKPPYWENPDEFILYDIILKVIKNSEDKKAKIVHELEMGV